MAPGSETSAVRGIADPPKFSPRQDLYAWRKSVENWVDLITVRAARGEDKHYKTVFATLGRHLYDRALPLAQQSIVDHAQESKLIHYKQDDQVAAVWEIVDLIAVDPPIVVITRLINSFNRVVKCKRNKNESRTQFVSRFHGLASQHLIHAGVSSSSQVGEVLAITLLGNANLGETTHQSAKIQLINAAQSRKDKEKKAALTDRDSKDLEKVKETLSSGLALSQVIEDEDILSPTEKLQQVHSAINQALELLIRVITRSTALPEAQRGSSRRSSAAPPRPPITLDDAVSVIRSLEQSSTEQDKTIFTREEINSMVQTAMLVGLRDLRAERSIPPLNRPKKKQTASGSMLSSKPSQPKSSKVQKLQKWTNQRFCFDCGAEDHIRGDISCKSPSFFTKKRRKEGKYNETGSKGNEKWLLVQRSFTSGQGAVSDLCPMSRDPNPLIDTGCGRNVGGVRSAAALCIALNNPLELHPLYCEPFYHRYGMNSSDAKIVFALWKLPLVDLNGTRFEMPFYVVLGDGLLLVGNDALNQSDLINSKEFLLIPPNVAKLSSVQLTLPVYNVEVDGVVRTFLMVVPSQKKSFSHYFSSVKSLHASIARLDTSKFNEGRYCKWFAYKLHLFTHFSLPDMILICQQASILTPPLRQALEMAIQKCTSCKTTGRPSSAKKVSFDKLLRTFNDHVQIDFLFIQELGGNPILHARDKTTGYSETRLLSSKDMDIASEVFQKLWVYSHGPPRIVSGDPEFKKSTFIRALESCGTRFEPRPARRHNKIGIVEARHNSLRLLVQRLTKDVESFKALHGIPIPCSAILSKATFLGNVLRGNSKLSSFELARGYHPSIAGLPQTAVSKEIFDAHQEQMARRAISRMLSPRAPSLIKKNLLPKGTPVSYFIKGNKQGIWKIGFVADAKEHLVEVSRNSKGSGHKILVAYEDIRMVPSTSLLYEMENIELDLNQENDDLRPVPMSISTPTSSSATQHSEEAVLWASHPLSRSLFSKSVRSKSFDGQSFDIDSPISNDSPGKDIGEYSFRPPSELPLELPSSEDKILEKVKDFIGDNPATDFQLQFVPHWLLKNAMDVEKEKYKKSVEVVSIRDIPRSANVISSHHYFTLKKDEHTGKFKLKCRMVPHGNQDSMKDILRSDSSTAQFPVIRTVLSMAALHRLQLAKIDISGSYLQAKDIERDIYVRPPTSWMAYPGERWKLLKPAYGLVDSGRLWQLDVEGWMLSSYKLEQIRGFPQLFVLRESKRRPDLFIAKFVDDFLLARNPSQIHRFHDALSVVYKVGLFNPHPPFVFNRLRIDVNANGDIRASMEEFMETIKTLDISRLRRKQNNDKASSDEITSFLSVTGKLNFLGHGVLPVAGFVASHYQQRISRLTVADMRELNSALKEVQNLQPILFYPVPPLSFKARYLAFSDASQGRYSYGQTGYISGLFFQTQTSLLYHVLDWHRSKQSRISFSSIGCEINAAAASADRASSMVESIRTLHDAHYSTVDSLGLYSTITTLHEGKDYRLRPTVARLRDSFESREISTIQWIAGSRNIADALTKRNTAMYRTLNQVCSTGKIESNLFETSKGALSQD